MRTVLSLSLSLSIGLWACNASGAEPPSPLAPEQRSESGRPQASGHAAGPEDVDDGSGPGHTAPMLPPVRVPGMRQVDHLIEAGEGHLAHLWKLTSGGENAEGYFSFAGDRLSLQRRHPAEGIECDRIFVTDSREGLVPVSNGRGVTTCAFFMPGDQEVLFASTQQAHETCPEQPFYPGYVWYLHPEYDLWARSLQDGAERKLTDLAGYDAEATVSPLGDRMVFTSVRSGDIELWTANMEGGELLQVTDRLGYDGGAFFSHDGQWLVFRSTRFADGEQGETERAEYRALLQRNMVKPSAMELQLCAQDGSSRRQLTDLGDANWAPYFFPDDQRVIFATNHHRENKRVFDLFALALESEELERITTYDGFDSFPIFSPDGRWLVFASNRGGSVEGETNLFLAQWRP